MSIWNGIIALMETKTEITDIISSSPMRIYQDVIAQGVTTYPAIEYDVNITVGNPTFDGASRIDHSTIRMFTFADLASEADNLWQVLRKELEDSSGTYSGLIIKNIRYVDSGQTDYLDGVEKHTKKLELKVTTLRTP